MGAIVILYDFKVSLEFCKRLDLDLVSHNHQPAIS